MNSLVSTPDKASEDHLFFSQGDQMWGDSSGIAKICKLGVTTLDEDPDNLMSPKHLVTSRTNS